MNGQAHPALRCRYKVYGFAIFMLHVVMQPAAAQEMLLFDSTFTATAAEHGFHYFRVDSGFADNWVEPLNYFEGTFHFRYEILDYPSADPFMLSVCIWSDVQRSSQGKWETWRETCAPRWPISGRGVFTTCSTPAGWWQINKQNPVDFTRVKDFLKLGIVFWCANGKNLSDWVPADKGCWPLRDALLPMKMRVTVVAVAKGHNFSGWSGR